VSNIDTSRDKSVERDVAEIIVSGTSDDRHLSTEPRKFTGSVCCSAAGRTNIVLGAILLVFRRPPVSSKNKVNIYAPNTDNHEIGKISSMAVKASRMP
jgi:hypothetical protein